MVTDDSAMLVARIIFLTPGGGLEETWIVKEHGQIYRCIIQPGLCHKGHIETIQIVIYREVSFK